MTDRTGEASPEFKGLFEGGGDELGPHVARYGPTGQASAPDVEHRGEIEPALTRRDVGDVTGVAPVRLTDGEVPLDEVVQWWGEL
jgi:hypothetical protein